MLEIGAHGPSAPCSPMIDRIDRRRGSSGAIRGDGEDEWSSVDASRDLGAESFHLAAMWWVCRQLTLS